MKDLTPVCSGQKNRVLQLNIHTFLTCLDYQWQMDGLAMKSAAEELELSGLLARFPLIEVLQFLGMTAKTGELRITGTADGDVFSLYFQEGHLVHASGGDFEGMAAFEIALTLHQGYFRFLADIPPPRQSLDSPVHHLLLESQRRVDELREVNSRIPPRESILFIVARQEIVPALNTLEWQVISLINGRNTLQRICQKLGDELTAKKAIQSLMEKGLVTARASEEEWHALVPQPVPFDRVREERPYPPLLRTNLLLKAIDGQRSLLQLQKSLRCRDPELLEDVKVLYQTRWIEYTPADENVFRRLLRDF